MAKIFLCGDRSVIGNDVGKKESGRSILIFFLAIVTKACGISHIYGDVHCGIRK